MRGRELKARHWAAGWRWEPTFRRGGILNRCYLCSPVPAAFVSVKVGVEQRILPTSRLLIFLHQEHLGLEDTSQMSVCWCG